MNHPGCEVITYKEYQKIKSKLLADAKALCKSKQYWAVCVAIKTVRNQYLVNKSTGYLFVANSDTEYYHKLEDWNFDGALVITVYLHEIDATTFTKYPGSYVKASSDTSDQDYETRLDSFIDALEHTPMIRRNTYAMPILIGVYDGTIQISSNIDMNNAIATVERLGAKYNVIKPNSAYAKDDYTLEFALSRDSQQSPEYINRLG